MTGNRKPKSARHIGIQIAALLLLAVLWPASYFWSEAFRIVIANRRFEFTTGPGWMAFTKGSSADIMHPPSFRNYFISIDPGHRSALAYTRLYSFMGDYRFYFPFWMFSMIMLLLAGGLIVSHARMVRNYKPGCCEKCGYDLRATPDRCPECGNPAKVLKSGE